MLVGDYIWSMPGQAKFEIHYNGHNFVFVSYGHDVRVEADGVLMSLQYRIEKDAFCLRAGDFYFEVSQMFGNNSARICLYVQEPMVGGVRYSPTPLTQDELCQLTASTKKPNRSVLLLIH